uniref:Uncharacterized protein n=1 Tax=Arundo donax TaxID=35708 RepID=A0A0A9GG50_ARUDO
MRTKNQFLMLPATSVVQQSLVNPSIHLGALVRSLCFSHVFANGLVHVPPIRAHQHHRKQLPLLIICLRPDLITQEAAAFAYNWINT